MGDTPTHANGKGMATAIDETSGGQSDAHHDKGITTETHAEISSPNHEHNVSSGDEKAANEPEAADGISATAATAATESANVDNTPNSANGAADFGVETAPKKKKKKPKTKKKGAAASTKKATGFEG